jgi:hypothetical protein
VGRRGEEEEERRDTGRKGGEEEDKILAEEWKWGEELVKREGFVGNERE